MRLAAATLDRLPASVTRFAYDRAAQQVGVVHFGIGAFHRAHQAWYTDLAMSAGERDWAICGVSLRSSAVAEQLNPQDGLYTLAERSGGTAATRCIGAVREVLFAPHEHEAVVARIAAPATRIVSFTVTEKGYARTPDGALDFAAAGHGFYPLLAEGLVRRWAAGLPGVTLLSCDNLSDNGRRLHGLLGAWIEARAPACTTGSTAPAPARIRWSTVSSPRPPSTTSPRSKRGWACATRRQCSPSASASG